MTSVTATEERDAMAEEVVRVDCAATGDTYVSRLSEPLVAVITPISNIPVGTAKYSPSVTISGRTLTFRYCVDAGTAAFQCIIKGRL